MILFLYFHVAPDYDNRDDLFALHIGVSKATANRELDEVMSQTVQ